MTFLMKNKRINMKRIKNANSNVNYKEFNSYFGNEEDIPLEKNYPKENTIEAEIQDGDTLQKIALRFNCTVAELKRLNKIMNENEIFARKVLKIPLTAHSVLLETLPGVHNKSGTNTPNNEPSNQPGSSAKFDDPMSADIDLNINEIILNTKLKSNEYSDLVTSNEVDITDDFQEPLLSGEIDDSVPQPRIIPIRKKSNISLSDRDISWLCLLISVLALCFAIPLIYVFYIAEHPEKYHHDSWSLNNETSKL